MRIVRNTKEKGIFYFLLYREKNDYVAVCLNLNLIEFGKNPKELFRSIEEAAFAHLEAVRKKNLSDNLLNILAPQRYWKMLEMLQLRIKGKPEISSLPKTTLLDTKENDVTFFHAAQAYSGQRTPNFCI